jgi:hypothetical protein
MIGLMEIEANANDVCAHIEAPNDTRIMRETRRNCTCIDGDVILAISSVHVWGVVNFIVSCDMGYHERAQSASITVYAILQLDTTIRA